MIPQNKNYYLYSALSNVQSSDNFRSKIYVVHVLYLMVRKLSVHVLWGVVRKMAKRSISSCSSTSDYSSSTETYPLKKKSGNNKDSGKWILEYDKSLNTTTWLQYETSDRYHVARTKCTICMNLMIKKQCNELQFLFVIILSGFCYFLYFIHCPL